MDVQAKTIGFSVIFITYQLNQFQKSRILNTFITCLRDPFSVCCRYWVEANCKMLSENRISIVGLTGLIDNQPIKKFGFHLVQHFLCIWIVR